MIFIHFLSYYSSNWGIRIRHVVSACLGKIELSDAFKIKLATHHTYKKPKKQLRIIKKTNKALIKSNTTLYIFYDLRRGIIAVVDGLLTSAPEGRGRQVRRVQRPQRPRGVPPLLPLHLCALVLRPPLQRAHSAFLAVTVSGVGALQPGFLHAVVTGRNGVEGNDVHLDGHDRRHGAAVVVVGVLQDPFERRLGQRGRVERTVEVLKLLLALLLLLLQMLLRISGQCARHERWIALRVVRDHADVAAPDWVGLLLLQEHM